MGLLYKDKKDVKVSVRIEQRENEVEFEFSADFGKFGTDELISDFTFTAEELLNIFSAIKVE